MVTGKNQELVTAKDLHQTDPFAANEKLEMADDGPFETQASLEEAARTFSAQFTAEAPRHILSIYQLVSASIDCRPSSS